MTVTLRETHAGDSPFLMEMLYEAVYWRSIAEGSNPPMEESVAVSDIRKAVDGLGGRVGDVGVVALVDGVAAGAAWCRFWTQENHIRGYIDDAIPVLIIAVHRDFRRQGIGQRMIARLVDDAARQDIPKMSLMVSKDNHAVRLYEKCGFRHYADQEDSMLMLRET